MPYIVVNPMNEAAVEPRPKAARLDTVAGRRVALLDISKPGGDVFLDRLETLLRERYGVADVIRMRKPTFARPAPENLIARLLQARPHAVIEALAD